MEESSQTITCPGCRNVFKMVASEPASFCPHCGISFVKKDMISPPKLPPPTVDEYLSNRYQLIESIAKGGMGEVFLAYDTICGRKIALKKIRADLLEHPQIRHRFLKEAHITCQLTHPAIIPIYSIQAHQLSAFYTMPFVEGETLKQILRNTKQQEKKGEKLDYIGGSIPALMRIFITICQAVAYAHSKGVLHRDLKPENIIIGKYGEVLILDWGLAKYIQSGPSDEDDSPLHEPLIQTPKSGEITRMGKIVGTVAYMAPERGKGDPATIRTDIYSLGVILYQMLTLRMPYKRSTLEEFRKNMSKEEWTDPIIVAPYRDVPKILSQITEKCLQIDPSHRYPTVDEVIHELENYLEGRSEWFFVANLDIKEKDDWEFQEHVLIAEHTAITRITEEAEWVNLMISKHSFTGNIRLETSLFLGEHAHGIGILFSIPEASNRSYINEGYCLWLSSDLERSTKLLRSNVEVIQAPDIILKRNQWISIRVEKIDKTIHLYLDDVLQFSYIAHLPLIGTHVGILTRDSDFQMASLKASVGSLNLTVNCLAVPDAFLAHGDYNQALSEYRRIAYSFPDRAEGREAIFRAGLTFLEQAKKGKSQNGLLEKALEEFEKLHGTPGGPLEYLGKALVYQTLKEEEEEIKCFEIAYRRYPHHPLLPVLQEQILSRLHEVSRLNRVTTYRFLLLTALHFSSTSIDTHTRRLFASLNKHWEPFPFIEESTPKLVQMKKSAIILAFWLAKPYQIGEMIDALLEMESPPAIDIQNGLACIIELGGWEYALQKIEEIKNRIQDVSSIHLEELGIMAQSHEKPLEPFFEKLLSSQTLQFSQIRALIHLLDRAIDAEQTALVHQIVQSLEKKEIPEEYRLQLNVRDIWAYLIEKNWKRAAEVIDKYHIELLNSGSTPLHFLYGCWLQGTEGTDMAMIHFNGLFHLPFPRSWTLASYELRGDLQQNGWLEKSFLWERRELYKQLALYYHCAGREDKKNDYSALYQKLSVFENS